MKFPSSIQIPPGTPVKKRHRLSSLNVPVVPILRELKEGSFYKIYQTDRNTILRVSKRSLSDCTEIEILKVMDHPNINKMLRWWVDDGFLAFEMELCASNLRDWCCRNREIGGAASGLCCAVEENNDASSMETEEGFGEYVSDGSSSFLLNAVFPSHTSPSDSSSLMLDPFTDENLEYNTSIIDTDDSDEVDGLESIPVVEKMHIPHWISLMMYHISSALSHVHKNGIVHMDVKPENILIKRSNASGVLCDDIVFQLCDFNISRIGEGMVDLDGDKVYMAPEVLKNRCYFKSDVFSLGLIYLELINGVSLPSTGESYMKLRRNDFEGWKVDEICQRMLEKNLPQRCSSFEIESHFRSLI